MRRGSTTARAPIAGTPIAGPAGVGRGGRLGAPARRFTTRCPARSHALDHALVIRCAFRGRGRVRLSQGPSPSRVPSRVLSPALSRVLSRDRGHGQVRRRAPGRPTAMVSALGAARRALSKRPASLGTTALRAGGGASISEGLHPATTQTLPSGAWSLAGPSAAGAARLGSGISEALGP